MIYAEASYFDGYAYQHIAAWEERNRVLRIQEDARALILGRRKLAALRSDVREVIDRCDRAIKGDTK